MRDANRLRRLVWRGSAPAGAAQQAAHSGGVGAPPGGQYEPPARSWLTVRGVCRLPGRPDGSMATHKGSANGRNGRQDAALKRKARPDAEGERRTVCRRTPRLRKKACKTKDRRVTRRAVPSLLRKGDHFQKLGRIRAARKAEHWLREMRLMNLTDPKTAAPHLASW